MKKIGFGGSCHWCTEAVFRALNGVEEVLQGWIASVGEAASFSEAVVVSFNPAQIGLDTLIAVHLYSHSCTSAHALRAKYRSAVYTFSEAQAKASRDILTALQAEFDAPIITQVLPFADFQLNEEKYLDYYGSDPERPFCRNVIGPKLKALRERFACYRSP